MRRIIAVLALLSLAACGGGGGGSSSMPSATYSAKSGVAQKGPLIKGSTVTAQELSSSLSPTGQQYSYQTTSDFGAFSPTNSFASQYIGTNASGYYFDEVANAVSTGPVTLNGYSDLSTDTVLNVNLLTTLEYQRIQNLVTKSSMTFAAARTQAENEVLAALNIPAGSYGAFSTLDISGGTDGDHILAAISSIFVYGNSAGPLSQLIANFQSDIGANGVITNAKTTAALVAASKAINPATVAANLTTFYAADGVVFNASDISDWISRFGDGVVGKFAFYVADATPSSTFTFPTFVVSAVAGTSISVTAGQLTVNGKAITGAVTVQATDAVAVSPGAGAFPDGDLTVYLLSGQTKTARVSFLSGLVSIAVTPNAPKVPTGLTQQFTATGTFSDTSTADVTNSVTWGSSAPTIATVSASSGLAQTIAVGSTTITAASGSVSGSDTLNVTGAVLESFLIVPNPAFSGVGLTTQLAATGTYSDGSTANVTTMATWTSSAPSVATVGPSTGLVSGVSLGSTTISATIGSMNETGPLSVTTNVWHSGGAMVALRESHTATLLQSGLVLVAGGDDPLSGYARASAELYDSSANSWSETGSLLTARGGHTANLLPNGMVLVAGGVNSEVYIEADPTIIASAELYDPVGGWSSTASMSTARTGHTATLLSNGQVLVAGGGISSGSGITASAELYDPVANTWSSAGSMATARFGHTATLLPNGMVLVTGGDAPSTVPNGALIVVATAELYDPLTNTWSPAASMANTRTNHTATLLPNGNVLVTGGFGTVAGTTTEVYDPIANAWSAAASMATARANHNAILLLNGTVLVAGGYLINGGVQGSAELYDPIANMWSLAGTMAYPQIYCTATLLSNGVVLAAGGSETSTEAELYW
jgi:N-acetylneuraminic acid mutarotase